MAIGNFEDHCWKDIISPEILETYTPDHRETYIGQRPALLAIDLYNLIYEGAAKQPHEGTELRVFARFDNRLRP